MTGFENHGRDDGDSGRVEFIHLPPRRRGPSPIVWFLVIFCALMLYWLLTHGIPDYLRAQHLRYVTKELQAFDPELSSSSGRFTASLPRSSPPPASNVVVPGPFDLPYSTEYRIAGRVGNDNFTDYLALGPGGTEVAIPMKNCAVINAQPFCRYRGTTVTRFTGPASGR